MAGLENPAYRVMGSPAYRVMGSLAYRVMENPVNGYRINAQTREALFLPITFGPSGWP